MSEMLGVFWTLGWMGVGAWLYMGIHAYGMMFAFFQREFSEEEAAQDLYKDMKSALKFLPQGFFGMVKAVHYLIDHDGWDVPTAAPRHGWKYLPRHEYRNQET